MTGVLEKKQQLILTEECNNFSTLNKWNKNLFFSYFLKLGYQIIVIVCLCF